MPKLNDYTPKVTARVRRLRRDQTDAERVMWSVLRGNQVDSAKFRRQFPVGKFIVDFCCFEKALVIEIDGGQHDEGRERDEERTAFLEQRGYRVLRFWNNEVIGNLEGVAEVIRKALEHPSQDPHPNPLPKGEGTGTPTVPSARRR